jgi:hypothetical protein
LNPNQHEPFDEFSDSIALRGDPYGFQVTFLRRPSTGENSPTTLGTIRLTMEHLKVISYMCWLQVVNMQRELGVPLDVPSVLLEAGGVNAEAWDAFWAAGDTPESTNGKVIDVIPDRVAELEKQLAEAKAEQTPERQIDGPV